MSTRPGPFDALVAALRAAPESRAVYRVQPEKADEVEVRLHVGCANERVVLLDVSALGAHLFVPAMACRALQGGVGRGRPVIHLAMHAAALASPLRLTARVVERRPVDGGYHVHLHFEDAVACGDDVDARLRKLFNRRAALRVPAPIDPGVRVRVAMRGSRTPISGLLLDASLTGVGVGLPLIVPASVPMDSPVAVILRLPHAREAASLRGRLRCWRPLGDGSTAASMLGVQFQTQAGAGCRASRDLARYVVNRQLELRRGALEGGEGGRNLPR